MRLSHHLISGEWQTRFDPLVTSKGAFYLDNQNSVSVDMMKSAQYPLRLLGDPELEAQVRLAEEACLFLVLKLYNITCVLVDPLHLLSHVPFVE